MFISRFVNFSICSDIYPEKAHIRNAWVVENFDIPNMKLNSRTFFKKFCHLDCVDFHMPDDENVSALTGTDIPKFHVYAIQGSKNQPIALLASLVWVLIGGIESN